MLTCPLAGVQLDADHCKKALTYPTLAEPLLVFLLCLDSFLVLNSPTGNRHTRSVTVATFRSPMVTFHSENKQVHFKYILEPCPSGYPYAFNQQLIIKVKCYPSDGGGAVPVDIHMPSSFKLRNDCSVHTSRTYATACLEIHHYIYQYLDQSQDCPAFLVEVQGSLFLGAGDLVVDNFEYKNDVSNKCGGNSKTRIYCPLLLLILVFVAGCRHYPQHLVISRRENIGCD